MMLLEYWSNVTEQLVVDADDVSSEAQPPSVEQVFHRYVPRVYSLAKRMIGHDADAGVATGGQHVQAGALSGLRKSGFTRAWKNALCWHRFRSLRFPIRGPR